MVTVKFKYGIGDLVKVMAIDVYGAVDSMSVGTGGEMYRVVYWNDGERNSVWMYEGEIGK